MDEDQPVDDSIGLLIGGGRMILWRTAQGAGTFFMIPGWTHHWKQLLEREFGNLSLDLTKGQG